MNPARAPYEVQLFVQPGTGKVEELIAPNQPGRVKFKSTSWPARFYNLSDQTTLLPNDPVTVVGRQGNTLLIVSANTPQ